MLLQVLKSKIHRVTVTEANLDYIGSITIDSSLMEAAGIIPGERVVIVDNNNGERFDTYAIPGEAGSRRVHRGDVVIIMAYALVSPEEGALMKPRLVFPDTATNLLPC